LRASTGTPASVAKHALAQENNKNNNSHTAHNKHRPGSTHKAHVRNAWGRAAATGNQKR
jgi:hypothetical protein